MDVIINAFWDNQSMRYTQGFAVVFASVLSIIGGILLFLTMLCHLGLYVRQRKLRSQMSSVKDSYYQSVQEEVQLRKQSKPVFALEVVSDVTMWVGISVFTLVFAVLSGFDFYSTAAGAIICLMTLLLTLMYQVVRMTLYCHKYDSFAFNMSTTIKRRKWYLMPAVLFLIFLGVFLPWIFRNSCLCIYNSGYGLPVILEMEYSSELTRKHWIQNNVCPDHGACHVYATLPSDTDTSVFINVHVGTRINELSIIYSDDNIELMNQCERQPFPDDVESIGQRNIFVCLLTDLDSDTTYEFTLLDKENPIFNSTYVTLPRKGQAYSDSITIMFGGDYGFLDNGRGLVSTISEQDVDVIIIGGDVAYDNGNKHCYYSWDLMLWDFEAEFKQIGRIIPFIFSVGNHDVGKSSMSSVNLTVSPQDGPLYFTNFPQRFANQSFKTGVPDVEHRWTYNYHKISDMIFVGLDSGYLYGFDGVQQEWLIQLLEQYSETYRIFVHYHDPIYPACQTNNPLMNAASQQVQVFQSQASRAAADWVPVFDKYHVVAAFENHVHQFKRTFPLYNGSLAKGDQQGTVYFGDGAMGINIHACKESQQTNRTIFEGFFAAYQILDSSHYWILRADSQGTLNYLAISPAGSVLNNSEYTQQKRSMKDDL